MRVSVLVAYATRYGSTREVAEAVTVVLGGHNLDVHLRPANSVSSLTDYQAVVLGAPLLMFRWHKDARRFLSRHRSALRERPAAVFALGPIQDTEQERQGARRQLDRALSKYPWFNPVDTEVFGGKFDPALLGFPWNWLPGIKKIPSGDIRDWAKIRLWADNLAEKLRHSVLDSQYSPPALS